MMRARERKEEMRTRVAGIGCLLLVGVFALSMSAQAQDRDAVSDREQQTLELLSKIDTFAETDEQLRMDSARAHYNMGNIYYYKGQFEIAVREYYQAVTLMPNDPDCHYNLAFVSGENLKDFRTALKHYRMYLYLSPEAKDAAFVRGKIMEAELVLRGEVNDSPLEKMVQEKLK